MTSSIASRVLAAPLLAVIRAYQVVVSPALPQSCRYYPSCSAYALAAIRRFGPLIGFWLTLRRLARCHPWCAGGIDHVPPRDARGRPDWAAHRTQTAEREAHWLAQAQAASAADVRHDDFGALHRRDAGCGQDRPPIPVRRGMP